jgi:uncharacterized protein (DUF2141 family)
MILVMGLLGITFIHSGCSKKAETSSVSVTTGTIKGRAILPSGTQGNLLNAKANLYNNVPLNGNHIPDRSVNVTGIKDSVNFTFSGLAAGAYYVEVWKDSLISGSTWGTNDLVGWYGVGTTDYPVYAPVAVNVAIVSNISITMQPMGNAVYGTITGPGDLSNSKVSLYANYNNWANNIPDRFIMVTGTGTSVTYRMTTVTPGKYFLDVWKDNDNSGTWSIGDYIGWYGSGTIGYVQLDTVRVTQNSNNKIDVSMIVAQ